MPRVERLSHVPVIAIVIALPSLSPAQEPPTFQFVDITARAGIDFTHVTGASGEKYMIETMGAGVVFFDYDGDLDPDLYLVNGGMLPGFQREESVTGALYRNDGQGRFSNVTAFSGLTFPGYGMGAAASDYDNDGDVDLYVTEFGPNRLFRNNGDGSFAEVAEWAGVVSHLWSVGASWSDLDGDGNLDLYVSNYLDFGFDNNPDCSQRKGGKVLRSYCLPDAFRGLPDALFRNRGDGTFEDVSQQAGIALPSGKVSASWRSTTTGTVSAICTWPTTPFPIFSFETTEGYTSRKRLSNPVWPTMGMAEPSLEWVLM